MKIALRAAAISLLFAAVVLVDLHVGAQDTKNVTVAAETLLPSPNIVISQFQVAGDGTRPADDEFIELHNIGSAPFDLNGHRLVYRSQSGTNDVGPVATWSTSTVIPPGGFYLIASNSYNGSVTPDLVFSNSTCACAFSASAGGLAIRNGAQNTGVKIDSVAWGGATNEFVEGTPTTAPAANNSQSRNNNGCADTDNNSADFTATAPAAPRNSSSPAAACTGGGATLFAAINANPTVTSPGGSILFTVTVVPATEPPSTAVAVAANLQPIGGSASQQFFDDGTNGDATPGDNVFSYLAAVPLDTTGGQKLIVGAATDAESRTAPVQTTVTIDAPLPGEDPLVFGNPSNATADVANENNYLMQKPQYTLSYNRSKATANWVAWRLDSSWIGGAQRQDDYRPDPSLPAGWYQVVPQDYSGSGYDRGHMTPSGDRTRSIPDNSATFLMTNLIPQLSANNQGPWEEFESYCRTLAAQGKEIYIFTGPHGTNGTIAQGRITVPQYTWKVALVLDNGDNDLARVGKGTRTIAIVVPNFGPLDMEAPWRNFRVSVNQVEMLTGYDFFSNVPKNSQELMERRRDWQ